MELKRILIVEDDLIAAQYLKTILEQEGLEVIGVIDRGREAIEQLRECSIDLVLMDIVLKDDVSGIEAALHHPECPVIFLSAFADSEMIDLAVDAKAIAYLMKPYRKKEIIATVKLALSRNKSTQKPKPLSSINLKGGFRFDFDHDRLEKDNKIIPLSIAKLRLIRLLALHHGNVVSQESLLSYIWDEPKSYSTLRSLVNRFRSSVDVHMIENVSGLGYRIGTIQQ